ncbi:MAG: PKD domain-containing protein [Thermoplasmata archaeon]|nr:PKD domain-containing protein [Thermoplasmata archaeon]
MDRRRGLRRARAPRGPGSLLPALWVLLLLSTPFWVPVGPSPPSAPVSQLPNAGTARPSAPAFPTPIRHVITVLLENEQVSTVLAQGPFEASLARQYGFASHYYAACHPSAPNYLALVTGKTWQCGGDGVTTYTTANIADLLEARHLSWGGYFESMPSACDSSDSYPYIAHHNPFVYPADIVGNATRCDAHDQGFAAWQSAVASGSVPNYAFVAANMTDDGHDTGVAGADAWLKGWLPPLLNASWASSSVFFILYDESSAGDTSGFNGTVGGHTYLVAVGAYVRANYTFAVNVTDYNVLTTTEWLLGTASLGNNDSWTKYPPMKSLFAFPGPGPLSVRASASATTGIAPLTVGFRSNVTGGSAPYAYRWTFGDGANATTADPTHLFSLPGSYAVHVEATDAHTNSSGANLTITVTNGSSPLRLTATASRDRGPVPFSVDLSANVTGGRPPYSVRWQYGDGSPTASGLQGTHTFETPGSFLVRATATDSNGTAVDASVTELAYLPLRVNLTLNRSTGTAGTAFEATAAASGGSLASGSYRWSINGLPEPGANATLSYRPAASGVYNVTVVVVDGWGDEAQGSATYVATSTPNGTNSAPPGPGLPLGPFGVSLWAWAALASVLGGAVAVLAVRARRAHGRNPTRS